MGSWSIFHWLIVLAVVILVFGTGKVAKAGKDLGTAIRGFKGGLKESLKEEDPEEDNPQIAEQAQLEQQEEIKQASTIEQR